MRYIFTFIFIPLFFIFLIGKPLFLIKLLNYFLHLKIKNIQIFHFLLAIFSIFEVYYYYSCSSGKKVIEKIIKNEIINSEQYSIRLSQIHSDERNIYIFLTCIAMLLTFHKFGERHLRIADFEKEIIEKEKKLGKTDEKTKKD